MNFKRNIRQYDYSIFAFRQLPDEKKEEYLNLARKKWCEKAGSEVIMEVVAANIWMEEMMAKEE